MSSAQLSAGAVNSSTIVACGYALRNHMHAAAVLTACLLLACAVPACAWLQVLVLALEMDRVLSVGLLRGCALCPAAPRTWLWM